MASIPYILDNQEGRPESVQAEVTILGAMMLEPDACWWTREKLISTDFSLDSHRKIYGAMLALMEDGSAIDLITVGEELRRRKEIADVGGPAYLASLTEGLPRNLSVSNYLTIVKDKSELRKLLRICHGIINTAEDQSVKADEIVSQWTMDMLEMAGDSDSTTAEKLGDITPRVIDRIGEERNFSKDKEELFYSTGIQALDMRTKGLFPNEYTIILGETGGAKTAWATQLTVENAIRGFGCLWFSQEMTKEQLTRRILAHKSRVAKAKDIRDPRLLQLDHWIDLQITASDVGSLPIWIDDSRQLPLDKLVARAKAAMHRHNVKIIVVDYIQLVRSATSAGRQSDRERVDAATIALRDIAAGSKEFGCHVIALSQYARQDPKQGGGGARNDRAKESSSIEQSAQNMFHIVREKLDNGEFSTEGEIVIGKQREGKIGRVGFNFDEDHLRFEGTKY